mmetsp:Transcript_25206/g.81509  ORF Transcript_25206/g.81509 Transcript_25206/m.81509 type:complete len:120 (-) Transcript_25206:1226-1585(-)
MSHPTVDETTTEDPEGAFGVGLDVGRRHVASLHFSEENGSLHTSSSSHESLLFLVVGERESSSSSANESLRAVAGANATAKSQIHPSEIALSMTKRLAFAPVNGAIDRFQTAVGVKTSG